MYPAKIHSTLSLKVCILFAIFSGNLLRAQITSGCTDTSYNFKITGSTLFGFTNQVTDSIGNTQFAGDIYMDPSFIKKDGLVLKTDRQGVIQWAKKIHASALTNIHLDNISILSDNNYFVIGRQFEPEDRLEYPFVAKFNNSGTLLWYKSYTLSFIISSDILIRPQQIAEDEDGNIYFSLNTTSPGYSIITKLNADGNILWSKGFKNDSRPGVGSFVLNGLFIQGNELLVTGASLSGFIGMKLNISDGNPLNIKNYKIAASLDLIYLEINDRIKSFRLDNGTYIIAVKSMPGFHTSKYMLAQFDSNLDIILTKRIDANDGIINASGYRDIIIKPTSEIIYSFAVNNTNKLYIGKTGRFWNIIDEKKFLLNGSGYHNTTSMLSITDNNLRITPGYSQPPLFGLDCYYLTEDNLLDQQCLRNEDTVIANMVDFWLTPTPFSWERIDNDALTEQPFTVTIDDEPLIKQNICKTISICDTLKVTGPANACLDNIAPVYSIIKNPDCLRNLVWEIDTSAISSLTTVNDTAISLRFKKEWSGYLYASLEGCSLKDSIKITSYKNNVENLLPPDDILCIGQNNILSPGTGFISYLWQNGSTAERFTVESPGKYWVTVTDNKGCTNSDTTMVINLVNPPSGFISIDTSICRYETLKLTTDIPFNSYLWSNGSTAPVLEISQPGNYSVQVTDDNGCHGEQAIVVGEKNTCINWIAFPTAFTPNNDGKNDDFKPSVRGNLIFFRLQVYNRWGQQVFLTTDPSKGWSGLFKSKIQTPDVFTWVSSYQFAGEPVKSQKGTVAIIQ